MANEKELEVWGLVGTIAFWKVLIRVFTFSPLSLMTMWYTCHDNLHIMTLFSTKPEYIRNTFPTVNPVHVDNSLSKSLLSFKGLCFLLLSCSPSLLTTFLPLSFFPIYFYPRSFHLYWGDFLMFSLVPTTKNPCTHVLWPFNVYCLFYITL